MSIRDLPLVLSSLSFPQIMRAVVYALRRSLLNASYDRRQSQAIVALGTIRASEIHGSRATFTFPGARLEIAALAEDLLRITWTPGVSPPPYAIDRSDWPDIQAAWTEAEAGWELKTRDIHMRLSLDGGIAFSTPGEDTLLECLPPVRSAAGWSQLSVSPDGERVYGLGERASRLDLRGGRYRMWNTDPAGLGPGADPLYLCVPVCIGLHRAGSYLVFHENPHDGLFDLSMPGLSRISFVAGALRYYFIPGPPSRALERYTALTGRPPMPASWALGHHHSRWGFRDRDDLAQVVRGFKEHGLTLDAIHLDIDHMRGFRVMTVDRRAFPEMKGFARDLAQEGIRLVAIVDPGVKVDPGYDLFQEGIRKDAFCRLPDGRLVTAPVWPGWAAFPDFTDRRVRDWWAEQYTRLLDEGFTAVWHDMNEPAAFAAWGDRTLPLASVHALDGLGGDHALAHNVYALQMARAGSEALRRLQPDARPFILTRSGWAGIQRYAWTWTGDTRSDWETLRQTIPTVLGLSLSGVPYSGPDIGGFSGHPEAELFIRWFQLATFMPFFRNHSAVRAARREPWLFGEPTLSIVRDHMHLRRRLSPYLYSLAHESSRTGWPLVRPLFWSNLECEDLWSIDDAFLLGDDLLVAPVLAPGAARRRLNLPPGRWFDLYGDARIDGPAEVELAAELERIPVLARGGAILPFMHERQLVLHVFPDRDGSARGLVYLDAGDGYGDGLTLIAHMYPEGRDSILGIRSEGGFIPAFASMLVTLHSMDVSHAWIDGRPAELEDRRLSVPVIGEHTLRFE